MFCVTDYNLQTTWQTTWQTIILNECVEYPMLWEELRSSGLEVSLMEFCISEIDTWQRKERGLCLHFVQTVIVVLLYVFLVADVAIVFFSRIF